MVWLLATLAALLCESLRNFSGTTDFFFFYSNLHDKARNQGTDHLLQLLVLSDIVHRNGLVGLNVF